MPKHEMSRLEAILNDYANCFKSTHGEQLPTPTRSRYQYALQFLTEIFENHEFQQREEFAHNAISWLNEVDHKIFRPGLLPKRIRDVEKANLADQKMQDIKGKNLVWLELGAYKAFPEKRIQSIKKEYGLFEFVRLDLAQDVPSDVIADAMQLPFDDATVDVVSSNSLIEHVPHPEKMFIEAFRVLRPGGLMLVKAPLFLTLHGFPNDYTRLCPDYYEYLSKESGFVEVDVNLTDHAGLFYTLHSMSRAERIKPHIPYYDMFRILHENIMVLLCLCAYFDKDFVGESTNYATALQCAAIKGGTLESRDFIERGSRLKNILQFLQCPITKQKLTYCCETETLRTEDGKIDYPIIKRSAVSGIGYQNHSG